jgi:alpha-tubulin suppressor-like RCC1 family protein
MNIALPTRVDLPAGEKFVDVSCGALHMAAINEKGEVYT